MSIWGRWQPTLPSAWLCVKVFHKHVTQRPFSHFNSPSCILAKTKLLLHSSVSHWGHLRLLNNVWEAASVRNAEEWRWHSAHCSLHTALLKSRLPDSPSNWFRASYRGELTCFNWTTATSCQRDVHASGRPLPVVVGTSEGIWGSLIGRRRGVQLLTRPTRRARLRRSGEHRQPVDGCRTEGSERFDMDQR